ncbi:xanthine dehydrogenase family protein subunit M [Rhodococcus sp. IEGM 1307]|uniref:FAD binding domain-containing protein n=1 Tax=Rhodococcus sp. IEGM 1307 TaxID=3047091 RepID=UPI0024B7E10B|nr:xanthine dehydrogenase family protein subunit M [Rhodococcus sp. IEGM 1307]MDI9978862.1 xanthine dehydrogenase family protein subunit M [Rhodococcus sp. IEGM 1307]
MKAAPFDYSRPSSVKAAIATLESADGDGKVIAGGQSLVPVLAMRLGRPSILVDINRIPGLDSIDKVAGDTIRVGALVRHADLLEQKHIPLLSEAAKWIGHSAIRTRGTTGGSIAHADPSAELPVVATALGATIGVEGPAGKRIVSADDLFVGPLETSLAESEIVTSVSYPVPERWGFAEFSRRHGDFGLVTVSVAVVGGLVRIAIGGVGAVPIRPLEAESILNGSPVTDARIAEAARAAAGDINVVSDLHASAEYRVAMTEQFTLRALTQAIGNRMVGAN